MMTMTEHGYTVRTDLRSGDLGRLIAMHGLLYREEYGFDYRFEAYVAYTLGEFAQQIDPTRDRLWLAESDDELVGSLGVIGRDNRVAQVRWVLVHPGARGRGLGRTLLNTALDFCRAAGYRSVYLWTVHPLIGAARLYQSAGFRLSEEKPEAAMWSQRLREQRYDLQLS